MRNHYGFDPAEQQNETYTGMGLDINVHDQWAVESPGPIADRTKEHLGTTDVAIIKYRRMMREAIKSLNSGNQNALPMMNGTDPKKVYGPISNDTIGSKENWSEAFTESDRERRAACKDWDATL